jgi:hypothetical protein
MVSKACLFLCTCFEGIQSVGFSSAPVLSSHGKFPTESAWFVGGWAKWVCPADYAYENKMIKAETRESLHKVWTCEVPPALCSPPPHTPFLFHYGEVFHHPVGSIDATTTTMRFVLSCFLLTQSMCYVQERYSFVVLRFIPVWHISLMCLSLYPNVASPFCPIFRRCLFRFLTYMGHVHPRDEIQLYSSALGTAISMLPGWEGY